MSGSGNAPAGAAAGRQPVSWVVLIPVLVALVTAAGSLFGLFLSAESALELEREKLQSQLIVKATEVRDPVQVLANLRFLCALRLISAERCLDQLFEELEKHPGRVPRSLGTAVIATSPPAMPEPAPPSVAATPAVSYSQPVFVQFAGTLRREDVRQAMITLRTSGWRVQGAELGGERTTKAAGYHEVRYRRGNQDDQDAADALVVDLNRLSLLRQPITAVPSSVITTNALEVWISN